MYIPQNHPIEIQYARYLIRKALPRELMFNNIVITDSGTGIYFLRAIATA